VDCQFPRLADEPAELPSGPDRGSSGSLRPFTGALTARRRPIGVLDSLTKHSFEKRDGRWIFYPYGILSRGFIVADDKQRIQLQRFVKRSFLLVAVALFLPLVTVGSNFTALTGPPVLLWYVLAERRLTRGLPLATKRLSLNDRFRTQARRHTLADLWTLEITSVLFVVASLGILIVAPANWIIAFIGILFFGSAALCFGFMIGVKR